MTELPIIHIVQKNRNLEILSKILNSVAKKYDCHVVYVSDEDRLAFLGDKACCRHIAEEALAIFSKDGQNDLPFHCPAE